MDNDIRSWMTLVEAVTRPKPRHLYHGTARQHIASIMATGMEPRIGRYVQNWYSQDGRALKPMILAADRRHLDACILAMFAAISDVATLAKDISMDEFLQYAALVVLPSETFQKRQGKADKSHPPQVESQDWYSLVPARPVKVLVNEELRPMIAPHFQQARLGWFGEPSEFSV